MSEALFRWRDKHGGVLSIQASLAVGALIEAAPDPQSVSVLLEAPASDVPGMTRDLAVALHQAAGLEPPIVLERVPPVAFSGRIHVREDGNITISPPGIPCSPEAARQYAAALAAAAERAEALPDRADVEALAKVLQNHDPGLYSTEAGGMARAILAAGWRPPEESRCP